jgi:hypothetical protein
MANFSSPRVKTPASRDADRLAGECDTAPYLRRSARPEGSTCRPNVPRGVRTIAEGEGLFKKTEITRQSAMTEADVGPGAGEE